MTDFEIVPPTPTTYDVNVTVNSVIESEVTPGVTGLVARVAALESQTVAGVPFTAGDVPEPTLTQALAGTPVSCTPGEVTPVTVTAGVIIDHRYVFDGYSAAADPPMLALPPAWEHPGQEIEQSTAFDGASGAVAEVIPADATRKPALDFRLWHQALTTTDFGAGDTVEFDLDGVTVPTTGLVGVMTQSDIITALLTPLITAGATNVGFMISSPTSGGTISITDPGTVLTFGAVGVYDTDGIIRTIDNMTGGKDVDAYYGAGTANPDFTLVGDGYGTHTVATGAYDVCKSIRVRSIPDPAAYKGWRWSAVGGRTTRSEFVPYSLDSGGGGAYYSNLHDMMDRLVDFQGDTPGTYAYEVELVDVDGVNVPTITLTTPGGVALSDSDPLGLGTSDAGTGTSASRDDHVHPLPSLVTLGAVALDRSARVLGGHAAGPAITDATSGLTTGVSLLNSTVTLPTNLAAGDVVRVRASVEGVNNSGGSRAIAFIGKIGSTSAVTCSVAWSAGVTTRIAIIDMMMRCTSTSAQTWDGTVAGAFPVSNTGSSAETTTSAKTFDLLMTSSSTASTQSYQVKHVSVMYFPA